MVRMGETRLIPATATSVMMVEQLGLEMMPWWRFTSSGLISGTTSGTSSDMRNALELSTNTAPAFTMAGANLLAISLLAAPSTMSMPSKLASVASSTITSPPLKGSALPALRALASAFRWSIGKRRSSSTFSISRPTAPVAPRMARLTFFISNPCFLVISKHCPCIPPQSMMAAKNSFSSCVRSLTAMSCMARTLMGAVM